MVRQTYSHSQFNRFLMDDAHSFGGHIYRVFTQVKQQKYVKENLPENQVYIHMEFAEDYRCRSQNEIQSAYWTQPRSLFMQL